MKLHFSNNLLEAKFVGKVAASILEIPKSLLAYLINKIRLSVIIPFLENSSPSQYPNVADWKGPYRILSKVIPPTK